MSVLCSPGDYILGLIFVTHSQKGMSWSLLYTLVSQFSSGLLCCGLFVLRLLLGSSHIVSYIVSML